MIKRFKSILLLVSAAAAISLTSCTALIHDAVINSYPSYSETVAEWPPLAAAEGRAVIMYPRLPFAGFSPVGVGGWGTAKVVIDDKHETLIVDETFVFIDLPAGEHKITTGGGLGKKHNSQINLHAGKVSHFKVIAEQFKREPVQEISAAEAAKLSQTLHHTYKIALPFDQLQKQSR